MKTELFKDDPRRGAKYFGGCAAIAVQMSAVMVTIPGKRRRRRMYSAREAGERAALAAHYAGKVLEEKQ